MDWSGFVVQWLHIFLGTFWFGGVLFANFIVIPAIMRSPEDQQGPMGQRLAEQADRIIPWVAVGTIVLGFVRGTVLGDIKDIGGLGTTYGIEWLVGLVAAIATFAWGTWVLNPAAARLSAPASGAATVAPAEAAAQLGRVKVLALLELVGFFVIFTTMILMHFASEA